MKLREEIHKHHESWKKSFLDNFSQDQHGAPIPWMTYGAIDFLLKNLQKNHRVFEFGCGASTLFFAKKVAQVTSLETRQMWREIIEEKLQQENLNAEITLMEDGLENELYENFPKNSGKKFDFIIVDSLKRFSCARNSIDALAPGGAIILDDSQRQNYQKIFDFFAEKKFMRLDFPGLAPGDLKLKNTTIFRSHP
jgi:predicted O-methyltransferase YrrM